MGDKIIFHIDVNSAYLSWTAVSLLQLGETVLDIRKVPSVIGGNSNERHGIILAKSIPAKKFKIQTGEPVDAAFNKCPNLIVYPPNYKLLSKMASNFEPKDSIHTLFHEEVSKKNVASSCLRFIYGW